MPRSKAVDYPQVRPPTVQPQLSLAPPQNFTDQARFSWQDSSNAEQQLEGGDAVGRQDRRQSKIPPLPTLPEHLGGGQRKENTHSLQEEVVLPTQQTGQLQVQPYNQAFQPEQIHFRPDVPRNQPQHSLPSQLLPQVQHQGPIPSYEASQAVYQESQPLQARMQEQTYPGLYNASQPYMSAHPLPMPDRNHDTLEDEHQSSEVKPEHVTNQPSQNTQPQQLRPIHVGPDVNPLSPTSPTKMTNTQILAPTTEMHFPQTTFSQPQLPRGGTWHHGLGSCAETTTCLSSVACPCIVYGRTQYRLSMKSAKKDPTNMLGYSSINGSCLAWSVLCGVNILMTAIQHTRIRKAYDMDSQAGNVASDCVKSICCCCCVLAQDEKEMKLREEQGRKGETTMTQEYISPGGMNYAPPPR